MIINEFKSLQPDNKTELKIKIDIIYDTKFLGIDKGSKVIPVIV